MSERIHFLFVAVVIMVIVLGCADTLGAESPSDVVRAAYMAANDGKEEEVEKRLSSPDPAVVEIVGILASNGRQQRWKPSVRKGSIQGIEILEEKATAYRAEVRFKLHLKDGTSKEMEVPLIKEGGVWKIER